MKPRHETSAICYQRSSKSIPPTYRKCPSDDCVGDGWRVLSQLSRYTWQRTDAPCDALPPSRPGAKVAIDDPVWTLTWNFRAVSCCNRLARPTASGRLPYISESAEPGCSVGLMAPSVCHGRTSQFRGSNWWIQRSSSACCVLGHGAAGGISSCLVGVVAGTPRFPALQQFVALKVKKN